MQENLEAIYLAEVFLGQIAGHSLQLLAGSLLTALQRYLFVHDPDYSFLVVHHARPDGCD
ncbi:hypothetical protein OH809_43755 (plasmid) [Streptomyces sp. NBC_00873]|uniref:hypothetical protein n=1 Tax=unclassified Streptomyces TaxID=2593676 RepID=UPI002F919A3A|nr:hypothetical protein OH809_43755 [Streptomyces sp. NBC_00873]WTA49202.1 hypothetical protein OH821_44745 [Streptomyces sp. NBC_00842]